MPFVGPMAFQPWWTFEDMLCEVQGKNRRSLTSIVKNLAVLQLGLSVSQRSYLISQILIKSQAHLTFFFLQIYFFFKFWLYVLIVHGNYITWRYFHVSTYWTLSITSPNYSFENRLLDHVQRTCLGASSHSLASSFKFALLVCTVPVVNMDQGF